MCFAGDSHPPIPVIAGAAVEGRHVVVEASDGNLFSAYRAVALEPSGAGILVLPDVRGLAPYYEELALRFAESGVEALAIDYFGRTAGTSRRGPDFDHAPHIERTTWAGLQADARAATAWLRSDARIGALFSVGFCFGGRTSFLLASLPDLGLTGVIGFYGWPVGPTRNDTPAPADVADRFRSDVLAIFGGADPGIPAEDVRRFEDSLSTAGVRHRIVTYPGAPHSFFDRKQAEFSDASALAWGEVLDFIRARTPPPAGGRA
jgi:carboxymethylenebutenolidase